MRCGCGAGRDLSSIVDVDPRAGLRASRSEHASFSLTSPIYLAISPSVLFRRPPFTGIAAISCVRPPASRASERSPFSLSSPIPVLQNKTAATSDKFSLMWKTTTSEPFCLTEGEGKSERKEERTETDVGTDGELGDQMNGGARREGGREKE